MKKVDEILKKWNIEIDNTVQLAGRIEIIFSTNKSQIDFVSDVRDLWQDVFHRPFDIILKCGCPDKVIKKLRQLIDMPDIENNKDKVEVQIIQPKTKRKSKRKTNAVTNNK